MPRMRRINFPQGRFHVLDRGLERRQIFKNEADKYKFLERLDADLEKTGHNYYAQALVGKYCHLSLRQSEKSLPTLVGLLLGGYALSFNRHHHFAMSRHWVVMTLLHGC